MTFARVSYHSACVWSFGCYRRAATFNAFGYHNFIGTAYCGIIISYESKELGRGKFLAQDGVAMWLPLFPLFLCDLRVCGVNFCNWLFNASVGCFLRSHTTHVVSVWLLDGLLCLTTLSGMKLSVILLDAPPHHAGITHILICSPNRGPTSVVRSRKEGVIGK